MSGAEHGHRHSHTQADAELWKSDRGIWAVKISFAALMATALLQAVVVGLTGSVALLADTIHNVGDALTALPLAAAFYLGRRSSTRRFTYGLSRSEDIAGMLIVTLILFSAIFAGYESIDRLLNPKEPSLLGVVALAGFVGFVGNEAVAVYRIRVGREIGSAALIADGKHARVDGLTSLAVVIGAAGVAMGFKLADPIVGLLITMAILRIVVHTARDVGLRALDAIEPETVDRIQDVASSTDGVVEVGEVRARWVGHNVHTEVNVAVASGVTVAQGHETAKLVRRKLIEEIPHLGAAIVHVDPEEEANESFHQL